jgi:hypothetical protein
MGHGRDHRDHRGAPDPGVALDDDLRARPWVNLEVIASGLNLLGANQHLATIGGEIG